MLPFPVLLALMWTSPSLPRAGYASAFLSYGALVLALMGGAHWALASGPYGRARIAVEWLIGLLALFAAWACLVLPAHLGLSLLIAAFFLLMLRDTQTAETGFPLWFVSLRSYVAAAAIVTSILALLRIIT